MNSGPIRYRSSDEDSARWTDFGFRDGDIVISTRSKSGTTWMQMICALLVFQTPEPGPVNRLSPWLDWLITPRDDVYAQLEAQQHRRFIKTHTPLDGIPIDPRATYIVVARHPLDMAVSLYHQSNNIDRDRFAELTNDHVQTRPDQERPALRDWLHSWVENDADPRTEMDSLPGVMWHLADAWRRCTEGADVLLVRYADLCSDLGSEMRRIADRLDITVNDEDWPALVEAATFEQMRAHRQRIVPDGGGVLKDTAAFFRRGTPGAASEVLTAAEIARYEARAAELAPPDMLRWLHER